MSSSSSAAKAAAVGPGYLAENKYGKNAVRFLRVHRDDARAAANPSDRQAKRHEVVEWSVRCQLLGDFTTAFYDGTNETILPTDTVKNTCYVFGKKLGNVSPEQYAITLSEHFFSTQKQVSGVDISVQVKPWTRLTVQGQQHSHAFQQDSQVLDSCHLVQTRGERAHITQQVTNLVLMKSTQSGFDGFIKDQYTTLPEVLDRIMCSNVTATWNYNVNADYKSLDFNNMRQRAEKAMIETFAGPPVDGIYSPSVQQTLYFMGQEVLKALPSVDSIHISMPNLHYLPVDISRFGLENKNTLFYPAYEPHGLIEATIRRKLSAKL